MVEVLPDRYLFLLPGTHLADAHRYAPEVLGHYNNTGERLRNAGALTEPVVLPPEAYPDMISFLEWGDVESLWVVDPANLVVTFGEGVEIVSIALEVTRDPVSAWLVEDLLHWTCAQRTTEEGGIRGFRVQNNSPRGWRSMSSFSLGRRLDIC